MPFEPGNKCACRADKLTPEEILQRKRERSRQWRLTHPYDPIQRKKYYPAAKLALALKPAKPEVFVDKYAPSKQKFAWDECPENLLNQ
jgi:hypothetical protein